LFVSLTRSAAGRTGDQLTEACDTADADAGRGFGKAQVSLTQFAIHDGECRADRPVTIVFMKFGELRAPVGLPKFA